eukprot:1521251-Ditylum_brightwellii.AAC.1
MENRKCLANIMHYYNSLPIMRKDISMYFVEFLSGQATKNGGMHRFKVHVNKMVTYSPFIGCILHI